MVKEMANPTPMQCAMRKTLILACMLAASISLSAAVEPAAEHGPIQAPSPNESAGSGNVHDLINKLGHNDIEQRDEATEQLGHLGARAIPDLQKACLSSDLEIKTRAILALREARLETAIAAAGEKEETLRKLVSYLKNKDRVIEVGSLAQYFEDMKVFHDDLNRFVGDRYSKEYFRPEQLLIIDDGKEFSILVIATPKFISIPGNNPYRADFYSLVGLPLGQTKIYPGSRAAYGSFSMFRSADAQVPLVKAVNSLPDTTHYFAVLGARLALVRVEDNEGALVRLNYLYDRSVGEEPTESSAEEWQKLLFSEDPIDILCALQWLSGTHRSGKIAKDRDGIEKLSQAKIARDLLEQQPVKDKIRQLVEHPWSWIREAARQAADPQFGEVRLEAFE